MQESGMGGEFLAYMEMIDLPTPRRILQNLLVATAPAQAGDEVEDTEIDLLLIHTSGIFVLEIKDYGGWIFGSSKDKYWTQCVLNGHGEAVKYKRRNPLRQNYCHTLALRQALALPFGNVPLHPIVAFHDRCEFKKLHLGPADVVVHLRHLPETIAHIAKAHEHSLSSSDVDALHDYLLPLAACAPRRRAEHMKTVEAKKQENHLE
ncbi:MAG: NERD domain-containing protein [Oscillospiraceae bacterium]|nr:NERD domain-containing protein [Oscillospiraceae bacterium]